MFFMNEGGPFFGDDVTIVSMPIGCGKLRAQSMCVSGDFAVSKHDSMGFRHVFRYGFRRKPRGLFNLYE